MKLNLKKSNNIPGLKNPPKMLFLLMACFLFAGCINNTTVDKRPNILLIVADDLGYGDIGCYGGEISTPGLDTLASEGVRFSSFHTAPMCAPTRAMLLSGNDNHIAGMGRQSIVSDEFGYEGMLTDRIVTVPALLRDAGYHTYMTGKWHLGDTPEANPFRKGFERSFALLPGAGNHYSNQSALSAGFSKYTEDGDSVEWQDGNYSTDFYTNKMISYIDQNKGDGKPFFAYAAYTSPHWPLQVDREYSDKYSGRYNDGYEILREKRLNSLKKAGMVTAEATLPQLHKSVFAWDSLSSDEKRKESRKMEIYAGMVDNLDNNIRRLFKYLEDNDMYNNTFIVFMSDNGAAYRDFIKADNFRVLREYYNDDYENMGNENSYISYGPQWAEAGSAPFRYFKDYATEGGMNTTLIISGQGVRRINEIHRGFTTLLDLAPTFYSLAGVEYPNTYKGHEVYPLKGISLLPYLTGETDKIHDEDYVFAIEHGGNASLRKGDWKITNFIKPFSRDNFALYYIPDDLGEQYDLRYENPEKYAELLAEWDNYAREIELQGFFDRLADSALVLTKDRVQYDPAYFQIEYPGGDIPADKGVCTDLIIRAYRKLGIDLQKEVHEDMLVNFEKYPKIWGLSHTDKNIDHRRVPNLMVFFERNGTILKISASPADYLPGDLVCWDLGNGITHIGLVSAKRTPDGRRPLIIHNIGGGQVLEDCLFSFKIIGHYNYQK